MSCPRLTAALLGAATAWSLLAAPALASTPAGPGVDGRVIGPERSVFNHSTEDCPAYELPHVTGTDDPMVDDIPDQPPRAFRTADGRVTLIASSRVVLRMVGPDLDHLTRDCSPVFVSPYLGTDASSYAMRLWMYTPYTPDGVHVYALMHTEYHGNTNLPATHQNCPSGSTQLCWYDAITLATSDTAGAQFELTPRPPANLVASIPYRYDPDANGAAGYFETSNIVQRGDYYYALMTAQPYGAQRRGTCLIRSDDLADPDSWRGWDGSSFDVRFINPYADTPGDPSAHVCPPVSPENLGSTAQGLVYSTYLDRYIAVDSGTRKNADGSVTQGVFYSTSTDLVHWTPRQLLWRQPIFNYWKPGDPNPIGYTSLIDPSSPSRNFETVGRTPYLYFVRDGWAGGFQSNRNLHRIRVRFDSP
jgi:hypothetical protein